MTMDMRAKAFKEYFDISRECYKCENEFLELPRQAAKKAGLKVDALFATEISGPLVQKYNQLKALEDKKRAALERFRELLK